MESFWQDGEALLEVNLRAAAAFEAAREAQPLECVDVVEDLVRAIQLEGVFAPTQWLRNARADALQHVTNVCSKQTANLLQSNLCTVL